MPRKPRELADDAIYHVFNRGNDKREIFYDAMDFHVFLKRIGKMKTELGAEIYHYCLMNNHFHLLLKVKKGGDLRTLMHRAQLSYALYFKKKYGLLGHLFQDRYRSPRIPTDSYYLQCGRYIERNPIKGGLVKNIGDYPYSSAPFYLFGKKDDLVTPNIHFRSMGLTDSERRQNYAMFLQVEDPYSSYLDEAVFDLK